MSLDDASRKSFSALYVLGALDGEELVQFEASMEGWGDPEKKEYQSLLRAAQLVWLSAPQQTPPPAVKDRLLERIGRKAPRPGSVEIERRPLPAPARLAANFGISVSALWRWVSLVLFLVSCILAFRIVRDQDQSAQSTQIADALRAKLKSARDSLAGWRQNAEVLDAPELETVALHSAGAGAAWGAVIWDAAAGNALLQVHGLPPSQGKVYVLWMAVDGQPLPVLRFASQGIGGTLFRIAKLPESNRHRINEFLVTREAGEKAAAPGAEHWLEGGPLL